MEYGPIPPVLIPVGRSALIEEIRRSFHPLQIRLVTLVNEALDLMESSLSPDDVELVAVPGGLDLGQTIRAGLERAPGLGGPLAINFGDTVLPSGWPETAGKDVVFYQEMDDAYRWTTFTQHQGRIRDVVEKGNISLAGETLSVFVGGFSLSDAGEFLKQLQRLESDPDLSLDSFYKGLLNYLNPRDYLLREAESWRDYGHIDLLYAARRESLNSRHFNTLEVDQRRPIVTKTSSESAVLDDEISWYSAIPQELRCYTPQVFQAAHDPTPRLQLEYLGLPGLGELFIGGFHRTEIWHQIIDDLFRCLDDFRSFTDPSTQPDADRARRSMYIEKTRNRVAEALGQDHLSDVVQADALLVNGRDRPGYGATVELIEAIYEVLFGEYDAPLSVIHGDFCLANLLYDFRLRTPKVIDPRGSFGSRTVYGDPLYDLAKLLHSFHGRYEFVIGDRFEASWEPGALDYRVLDADRHKAVEDLFVKMLRVRHPTDFLRIRFIEAVLFLSMVPLHADRPERQVCMLGIGLDALGAVLEVCDL